MEKINHWPLSIAALAVLICDVKSSSANMPAWTCASPLEITCETEYKPERNNVKKINNL